LHNKHQIKFILAGICSFNLGAIVLALFGLDWLGWSMMSLAAILWLISIKHTPY